MRRLAFAITALTLGLSSCNSFNRTTISLDSKRSSPPDVTGLASPSIPIGASGGDASSVPRCPVYTPPTLPAIPDLPYQQLQEAARSGKENAVTEVIRQHILALRLHAHEVERIEGDAYADYLKKCK